MTYFNGVALIASVLFCSSTYAAQEDVPIPFELKKVEGSELLAKYYAKSGEVYIPGATGKPTGQTIGLLYHVSSSSEITPNEIFSMYEADLKKEGFKSLARNGSRSGILDTMCTQLGSFCGRGSFKTSRGTFTPKNLEHDKFSTFKKTTPEGEIHVAVLARKVSSTNAFTWSKADSKFALMDAKEFQEGDNLMLVGVVLPRANKVKLVKEDVNFMRESLETKGSVDLYGIYFDTNKSILKPESQPTLVEIAKLMSSNAGLSLLVVGHTDNVGSAASNQKLSESRAAAVVTALTKNHGADAKRLKASGSGATKPVGSNDTEEGRAKNRRVELVKNTGK